MNGVQRGGGGGKWKTLRERLGFKGIGCCGGGGGAIWGFGASSNMRMREEDEDKDDDDQEQDLQEGHEMPGDVVGQIPVENSVERDCVGQIPAVASGINLAMALAAERHFRAATHDWDNDDDGVGVVSTTTDSSAATPTTRMNNNSSSGTVAAISNTTGTPMRVSLMRLLEDGDGDGDVDEEEGTEGTEGGGGGGGGVQGSRRIGGGETTEGGGGNDVVCCVCMRRKKGAAFIPCGHTFCRVCSRELWLNRGSCPLCNRSILEILDIF